MGRGVIDHQVWLPLLVLRLQVLSDKFQELGELFGIGALSEHHYRIGKAVSNSAEHGNAFVALAVEGNLYRRVLWLPAARLSHPNIDRRLVEINDRSA